ncbi:hypothetical protein D3C85_1507100 [compost metagenome]
MLELGVGRSQVRRDIPHFLGVGAGIPHPFLRLAHLGRGDHLHRLGDLARVLHALDLGSNLFRSGHIFLSIRFAPRCRCSRRAARSVELRG